MLLFGFSSSFLKGCLWVQLRLNHTVNVEAAEPKQFTKRGKNIELKRRVRILHDFNSERDHFYITENYSYQKY